MLGNKLSNKVIELKFKKILLHFLFHFICKNIFSPKIMGFFNKIFFFIILNFKNVKELNGTRHFDSLVIAPNFR